MSLVDTAVVGAQSSVELAALGPATSLCDNLAYMCGFLAQVRSHRVGGLAFLNRVVVVGAAVVAGDATAAATAVVVIDVAVEALSSLFSQLFRVCRYSVLVGVVAAAVVGVVGAVLGSRGGLPLVAMDDMVT